ncbi:hypothetical protein P152DRAFT_464768 [Eremomyces bilateralis CBS 781.70]|uniref:Cyclin-like protein n=1 Tax=Eremomyces bilateralis CBS 781.70 TaxID=1392243 RepID=A0A6G1G9Y8_9PEZI|nr:uncharacterized protein P152DRAFT_464768 [Eremomyces bilateralis CBS 781.70]KAF1814812.1 hypothetical protein P152DRAFT_464768 [Eremomyces bilateralis CBS 781.70]
MPAFYPRSLPRGHLPLTPPEYVPSYSANPSVMQYPQSCYPNHPNVGRHEEAGYDYSARCDQSQVPAAAHQPMVYHPNVPAYPHPHVGLAPVNHYYDPVNGSTLPPMRPYEQSQAISDPSRNRQVADRGQSQNHARHNAQDEKATGGVSAKLDYDMEMMTDFVAEMAQGIIQRPGQLIAPTYRKWVNSVLTATRLPKATILLSLHYLSIRMQIISSRTPQRRQDDRGDVLEMLTTALILGSKFADDNTFINRSWSEVSSINVKTLNRLEREWLGDMVYTLHRDPAEPNGFNNWLAHWEEYEFQSVARSSRNKQTHLTVETNGLLTPRSHHDGVDPTLTPLSAHPHSTTYPAPSQQAPASYSNPAPPPYSQYDPWANSRTDSSPISAPHTGPNTPEYYGTPGVWTPTEGYSRRTMFGFPPQGPPPQSQGRLASTPAPAPAYGAPHYPHHAYGVWTGNGTVSGAYWREQYAPTQQPPYMMGYVPQTVVG